MNNPPEKVTAPIVPEHIPPCSVEAEEAVLGSVLISVDCLIDLIPFLLASDFFIARHMWIWEALLALYERGESIDNITLIQELRQRGQLGDIGGPAYITYLINNTPTHTHAVTYGRIVEHAAIRRRLLNAAGDIAQMALEENAEITLIMGRAIAVIDEIAEQKKISNIVPIKAVVSDVWDEVEQNYANPKLIPGFELGFPRIDKKFGGFDRGTAVHWILPTSGGKTLLTVQVLMKLAEQTSVLLICTETGLPAMIKRMVNQKLALQRNALRTGHLNANDYKRVQLEFAWLDKLPIRMLDLRRPTVQEIRTEVRRLKQRTGHNFGAVIVDSASNVKSKGNSKIFDVTRDVATSLSEICSDFDVFGMVNWQQNRESYEKKSATVTSARGGGDVENEADFLFTFDMPDYAIKTGMKKAPKDWVRSDKELVTWKCLKDRHLGYAGISFEMWRILGKGFFDVDDNDGEIL